MHWYLIPILHKSFVDDSGQTITRYVPGAGAPGFLSEAFIGGGFVAHAHDPREAPTTALVGVGSAPDAIPEGWAPKTLAEAKAYFELVVGRAPADSEVF